MKRGILAILAFALMGCSTAPQDPPPTSIKPLDQAKVQAAKLNIQTDVELAPCNIKVSAQNDLLLLSGGVPSEAAKKKAEDLARRVEGIHNVANHLLIQPETGQTPGL